MFGALPAVSAVLWVLATAYYVYERALVGRQGAYFMVSVLGLLIGYPSGCGRCCANFPLGQGLNDPGVHSVGLFKV